MRRVIKNPDVPKLAIAIKALEVIRDSPGGGPSKRIAMQALDQIKDGNLSSLTRDNKEKVVKAWIPKLFLDKDSRFAGIAKLRKSLGLYEGGVLIQVELKPITTRTSIS